MGPAEGEYVIDVGWIEGLKVEARTGEEVGITEGAEVDATDGHTASFTDFDGLKVY